MKTAIEKAECMIVEEFSKNTDILVMMIHHSVNVSNKLYFTTPSASFSPNDIYDKLTTSEQQRLLLYIVLLVVIP